MADSDDRSGHTPLQQALLAVRDMRARLDAAEAAARQPIAVIGTGLRLPGGLTNFDEFAAFLAAGAEAIRTVPSDRWDADRWFDADPDNAATMIAREAGFLDDVAKFDAAFFGISPREALEMDPAQRLLLQVAWEAFEHAGLAPDSMSGTQTGVWVGLGLSDYARRHFLGPDPARIGPYAGTGSFLSVASGRVAYTLGLQGPAVTVDTACSSSLVSLHLAMQSLRSGETNLALAGGANLLIAPEPSVYFSKLQALSPDGRSKAFDAAADGYGRGEGVALVVLERHSDAVKHGHRILGVIRGSAVNQDGRSNGLTAPSGRAQQQVIRAALDAAGVAPSDVDFIEAHGTGTPLGDPIEMDALKAVYGQATSDRRPLWVGSVKTQLGHLETAAGVTGLLKVLVGLRAGQVPQQRFGTTPNPRLGLAGTRIRLAVVPAPLAADRRAIGAVSSFGLSGTNAHVVVQAAPAFEAVAAAPIREAWPLLLSARGLPALRALATAWASRLDSGLSLRDAAYTSVHGRAALADRLVVAGTAPDELAARLRAFVADEEHDAAIGNAPSTAPTVVFLFTGQGAQHTGMGLRLSETFPVFREALERCAKVADPLLPRPLLDVMFGNGDEIHDTRYTQPALFAYEYAMAALWQSVGVEPDAALGHSVGEIVAAVVSGALVLEPALRLVVARGRLMSDLPRDGAMLAVFAPLEDVETILAGKKDASVAGVNGPRETVVSGAVETIEFVAEHFRGLNVRVRHLAVSHAFHSPLMDGILDAFEAEARQLVPGRAHFPVFSNLDGKVLGDRAADPHYWRRHLREAVRFSQGLNTLRADDHGLFLELGPNPILSGLGARIDSSATFIPSTREEDDDEVAVLHAAGALWARGVAVAWPTLVGAGRCVDAPTYPWQGETYWLPPVSASVVVDPLADVAVEVSWVPAPPVGDFVAPGAWLLLGPVDGLAGELGAALNQRGHQARVVDDLFAVGEPDLRGVVDCRGAGTLDSTLVDVNLSEALERVVGGALRLLQAVSRARLATRAWLVTRGAFEGGTAPGDLASAGAHGAFRVAATEMPDRVGGAIDVDGEVSADDIVDRLLAPSGEVLRLREDSAWVARLTRVSLSEQSVSLGDGAWLVTGGWGALGRRVLRSLVEQGVHTLVVASRSGAATSEALAVKAELVDRGVSVTDVHVDLSDTRAVQQMVSAIPNLSGVVHAAGAAADGPLSNVDWDDVAPAVLGKAVGAWNLHLALAFHAIPFVLFSSAAAVVGTAGQAAYAASNAVLDAVARARRLTGLPATSVAFGPWDGEGLAGKVDEPTRARWAAEGVRLLDPMLGDAAWRRAAHEARAHVVIAPFDWDRYAASRPGPSGLYDALRTSSSSAPVLADNVVARWRGLSSEARREAVAVEVQAIVAAVLGLAPGRRLDADTGFFDAGLDSLMAVDLRNRLAKRVGVDLSATVAFDFPNVRALVRHLLVELGLADVVGVAASAVGRSEEPIAIVGTALRMPGGARDLDSFAKFLVDGTDAISDVPRDRFDVERYFDPSPATPGKLYSRTGGFVEGIEGFEPACFGISPREAASLDPQQRMLLESAWEVLEDAGIVPHSLADLPVGVFVGVGTSEYWRRFDPVDSGGESDPYNGTGNEPSFAAGRLSFVLGVRGPSMSINTACSSSLVAIHQAVAALRSGECRLALAGGVNAIVGPETTILMAQLRALAPDGRCKTFDAAANGYVRSEGCGMVALERLSDAVAAGHRVLGVVRGSAVNHDGRSSGLTVPSGPAQAEVIRSALAAAGVSPSAVGFVECHGTGTSLGDPIEVGALRAVLGVGRPADHPLTLGAVKSHVGHLEAGAGMAGLFAALGALRSGVIPPVLHLSTPNPSLPTDWPVQIPAAPLAWPRPEAGRFAGVSSFGISGTNAHVVLGEAPDLGPPPESGARPQHLVTLSARTPAGVAALAERLADALHEQRIDDVAFTLNIGRSHLAARAAVSAADLDELAGELATVAAGRGVHSAEAEPPKLVFLCTGAGPQQAGMGRALYDVDPAFRAAFDACCAIARPYLDRPLDEVVFPSDPADTALHELKYTQPAMFALEWAMAKLWESFGIVPDAVIGHSTGQYVAATLAGVFSLDDGMRLMCQRAALMSSLPHDGEMVAIFASAAAVSAAIAGLEADVAIAAVNGPAETVISGTREPVNAVADRFEAKGVEIRRLRISHAAHSPRMEPILDSFEAMVAAVTRHRPKLVLIENVQGAVAGEDIVTPAYWRRHMRQSVQFLAGMETLAAAGYRHFVEIGNHPILAGAGGRCLEDEPCTWYPSLRRGEADWKVVLDTLGRLWESGVTVDWAGVHREMPGRRIGLPTTVWQRRRHWVDRVDRSSASLPGAGWVHRTSWESVNPGVGNLPQPVLVLCDAQGIGRRAAEQWPGAVVRDDVDPGDALAVAQAVGVAGAKTVAWFGALDAPDVDVDPMASARHVARGAVGVAGAAARVGVAAVWVTRGAMPAGGGVCHAGQATTWGVGNTVSVELPNVDLRRVDLDPSVPIDVDAVVGAVGSGLPVLALRGKAALVPRLRREEPAVLAVPGFAGTVLITGGLGAIGSRLARWLSEAGAPSIVLVGRRKPQPDVAAELDRLAARVEFVQGDVGTKDGVDAVLAEIGARGLSPVRSLFHAAGTVEDVSLLNLDASRLERPWGPKIVGTWALDSRLPDLDHFVVFSSAAAMVGSPGQANYAAANSFMDAIVLRRRARGVPALSIGWGPWAEAGLATEAARNWEAGGVTPMPPSTAVAVLARLLGSADPMPVVVAADWPVFCGRLSRVPPLLLGLRGEVEAVVTSLPHRARVVGAEVARRGAVVADLIAEEVAAILGLEVSEIPHDKGFFDIGFDSLMAVEFRARLKDGFGVALPATVAFDHPNVEDLARHLLGLLDLDAAPGVQAVRVVTRSVSFDEPIAVVGIACRYPGGADTPEAFWKVLRDGVDPVREVPPDRWDIDAWYDPTPATPGRMYTRQAAFLDGVDQFDPEFFQISPREAMSMDPQQRIFLEIAWEALENAGLTNRDLRDSRTGVFVGVGDSGYLDRFHVPGEPMYRDTYAGTGNLSAFVAGRVAYVLGVHGPTFALNTACSSTLVATHLASQALRTGDCDTALAGGVHLMLSPENFVYVSQLKALSPDGRCKTFDASADGYGRAEGAGILVLRRLSDAQRDGNPILAVLRGTAVNHDGPSSGLTVPNGAAQQGVIREALDRSGVDPLAVSYLEAHGTGTVLGDPIEVHGIEAELCVGRSKDRPLHLGAAKSNVGHMEVAAGSVSLIKMVLALTHREIPPHLHFTTPNPDIELEKLPIVIDTRPTPWEGIDGRRIAGISAFGLSGTNAHVVMEEAPERAPDLAPAQDDRGAHVLVLSARRSEALRQLASSYGTLLSPGVSLADVAFAAATKRMPFENRLAVVARDASEAKDRLASWLVHGGGPGVVEGLAPSRRPRIAFLFSGQGSQWAGMARGLYATQPVFRASMDRCAAGLVGLLERPLLDVVFDDPGDAVHDTRYTQPALFAVEVSLAALWTSFGVRPDAVIGHSIGEIAAACFAGVMSLQDGLRLVAERGRLMAELPRDGAMVALFCDEVTARAAIADRNGRVDVAAVNNPTETVISGVSADVAAVAAALQARGIDSRSLVVSHAFHSSLIEPMLDPFEAVASGLSYAAPTVPLVSNLTGQMADGSEQTGAYWRKHVRGAVRFLDGIRTLLDQGVDLFIEIGPHPTLLGNVRRTSETLEAGALLASLKRDGDDEQTLLAAVGGAFARGVEPDWVGFEAGRVRRPVILPNTPFIRRRIWLDAPEFPGMVDRVGEWLYEVVWRDRPTTSGATTSGRWILVGDGGLGAAVEAAWTAAGATVERSASGEGVVWAGVSGVVLLSGLEATGGSGEALRRAVERGPGVALRVVQGLAEAGVSCPFVSITRGAADTGDGCAAPDQAALLGFGRVVALEQAELSVRMIDLPEEGIDGLVDSAMAADHELEVAIRGGKRLCRRLVKSTARGDATQVKADRSYLVSGGLGALGLLAAEWLVKAGAGEVILTSRSAPTAEVEARLAALRSDGAMVVVARGDVAVYSDVDRIVKSTFHPVGGVIHAAGVLADSALLRLDAERLHIPFGPKGDGTYNLHEATRAQPLDFFVVYSGGASLLGSPGQANYAAANAFLDAFASWRRRQGLPGIAIGWGAWAEVGMAARLGEGHAKRQADEGIHRLPSSGGVKALARLLTSPVAHVGVLRVDWQRFVDVFHKGNTPAFLSELVVAVAPTRSAASSAPSASSVGESDLERAVAGASDRTSAVDRFVNERVIAVLGLERTATVDRNKPMLEMGLDSLLAIELKNALNRGGIDLPVARLMTGPSVAVVTQMIMAALDERAPKAAGGAVLPQSEGAPANPILTHLIAVAVGMALMAGTFLVLYIQGSRDDAKRDDAMEEAPRRNR